MRFYDNLSICSLGSLVICGVGGAAVWLGVAASGGLAAAGNTWDQVDIFQLEIWGPWAFHSVLFSNGRFTINKFFTINEFFTINGFFTINAFFTIINEFFTINDFFTINAFFTIIN